MKFRLNFYTLFIMLLSPVIWSMMMYLTGLIDMSLIMNMVMQPKTIIFMFLYVAATLLWLNKRVISTVENISDKTLGKVQRVVLWFPVEYLTIIMLYAVLGGFLAISVLPGNETLVRIISVVFALTETFCILLPFYVLAINTIESRVGKKAFDGNNRNFPLYLRVGSGLIGLIISTMVTIGVLFFAWQLQLAQEYAIPRSEIFVSFRSMFALMIILIIVAVAFIAVIMRSISQAVGSLAKQLQQGVESAADLTVRLPVKAMDESGKVAYFFNQWLEKLSAVISTVKENGKELLKLSTNLEKAADESGEVSRQMATAVEQISQGAEDQAFSLDNLNKYVQEINETARTLKMEANKIRDLAKEAAQVATDGENTVLNANQQMETLGTVMGDMAGSVDEMAESADNISKVTQVIEEIADRTRLLSLNAAIEAAQAGEQGRGFAVVAEEIRKLADNSVRSTEEIKNIVEGVQKKAHQVQKQVESGREAVEDSIQVVRNSKQSFIQVKGGAQETSEAVERMFALLQKLVSNVEDETEKVGDIASIAQETAASAQEGSASMDRLVQSSQNVAQLAKDLAKLANEIENKVAAFKVEYN